MTRPCQRNAEQKLAELDEARGVRVEDAEDLLAELGGFAVREKELEGFGELGLGHATCWTILLSKRGIHF